jgi:hypothetical protein
MDVRPDDIPPTEAGTFEDEQRFGEWIGKRLEIYQTLEQQIQTAINQTVHFASELTRRMEDDTDRLLARYRQQRQEQQQARDALLQEQAQVRAQMEEDQRAYEKRLFEARQAADAEIARMRSEIRSERERVLRETQNERERMLREAAAERERVIGETRQLSARLAGLQRSLNDILQIGPMAEPVVMTAPVKPLPGGTLIDIFGNTNAAERAAVIEPEVLPSINTSEPLIPPVREIRISISDVDSFVVASDLIDQLTNLPDVEATQLIQYEQKNLTVAVSYGGRLPLTAVIREHLSNIGSPVERDDGSIQLNYSAGG